MADITLPCGHSNYDMCACGEPPAEEADLMKAVERYEAECKTKGQYMPALATRFRLIADELADRYPDDTNGGQTGTL